MYLPAGVRGKTPAENEILHHFNLEDFVLQ